MKIACLSKCRNLVHKSPKVHNVINGYRRQKETANSLFFCNVIQNPKKHIFQQNPLYTSRKKFSALCKMYIFIVRLIHETDSTNFFKIGALLILRQKVDSIANLKILDESIKKSTRIGGRCISREWIPPAENEPS